MSEPITSPEPLPSDAWRQGAKSPFDPGYNPEYEQKRFEQWQALGEPCICDSETNCAYHALLRELPHDHIFRLVLEGGGSRDE